MYAFKNCKWTIIIMYLKNGQPLPKNKAKQNKTTIKNFIK